MVYSAIAARDFGNSAIGGTHYPQTIAGLNMSCSIAERWSGRAGISYEFSEYHESARVDKFWTANRGLNYSPHRFVLMSVGYVFLTNEATVDIANFDSTARY